MRLPPSGGIVRHAKEAPTPRICHALYWWPSRHVNPLEQVTLRNSSHEGPQQPCYKSMWLKRLFNNRIYPVTSYSRFASPPAPDAAASSLAERLPEAPCLWVSGVPPAKAWQRMPLRNPYTPRHACEFVFKRTCVLGSGVTVAFRSFTHVEAPFLPHVGSLSAD